MLTLYFAPGASSMAVHIALHEIGVPFEGRPMSFRKNDLRSSSYLALNPEGKVPTLDCFVALLLAMTERNILLETAAEIPF
jgi:glutathione S-transferase